MHKIIPSFSIMGISAEYEKMAQMVQENAINHEQSAGISEMIQQLEKVIIQSCEELKDDLNKIKNAKDEYKK